MNLQILRTVEVDRVRNEIAMNWAQKWANQIPEDFGGPDALNCETLTFTVVAGFSQEQRKATIEQAYQLFGRESWNPERIKGTVNSWKTVDGVTIRLLGVEFIEIAAA